jgi:BirA family biotin operon repressor/biotin-[acetyl-CoA-carboxylase] ligase
MSAKIYNYNGVRLTRRHFSTVTSTITIAKEIKDLSCDEWRLITADMQTAGISKCSVNWISPKSNLSATYIFKLEKRYLPLVSLLPFAACLSVCQTVLQFCQGVSFKWPNDILLEGKKISGILSEFFQDGYDNNYYRILISVGLNVNASAEELAIVQQPITSLKIHTNKTYDVDQVLDSLSEFLICNVLKLIKNNQSPIPFLRPLLEIFGGETVQLQINLKYIEGKVMGITDMGYLEFKDNDNNIIFCNTNEEIASFVKSKEGYKKPAL